MSVKYVQNVKKIVGVMAVINEYTSKILGQNTGICPPPPFRLVQVLPIILFFVLLYCAQLYTTNTVLP